MTRASIACALILALSGCAVATHDVRRDEVEDQIITACTVPEVRETLPHVCADPARFARDAEVAATILKILIKVAL